MFEDFIKINSIEDTVHCEFNLKTSTKDVMVYVNPKNILGMTEYYKGLNKVSVILLHNGHIYTNENIDKIKDRLEKLKEFDSQELKAVQRNGSKFIGNKQNIDYIKLLDNNLKEVCINGYRFVFKEFYNL